MANKSGWFYESHRIYFHKDGTGDNMPKKGWFHESKRHSLAVKSGKT